MLKNVNKFSVVAGQSTEIQRFKSKNRFKSEIRGNTNLFQVFLKIYAFADPFLARFFLKRSR